MGWRAGAIAMLALTACGHTRSSPTAPRDAGLGAAQDAARVSTPGDAAKNAAETSAACKALGPFYWEVGDARGVVASGSIGDKYDASARMPIASATKLLWGAYVVERSKTNLAAIDMPEMTMRSGYTSFKSCVGAANVAACFGRGDNGKHNASDDGFYAYGGGHFQKQAIDLGLGAKTNDALAQELASQLGSDLHIGFDMPQPAGGGVMAPGDYGRFLRKLLDGSLALGAHLGEAAVCTLSPTCSNARESPVPEAWHYSYGHWVEDDPTHGDGSFSSPGLFGFYPWISAKKDAYGIVARHASLGLLGAPADTAYWKSVLCGRAIRKAYVAAR